MRRSLVIATLLATLLLSSAAAAAPAAPDITLTAIISEGLEGDAGTKVAVVTLTQTPPQNFPVTYNYRTIDGTATAADGDYNPLNSSVIIPAGETTATIPVEINGDTKVEANETFTLLVDGVEDGEFIFNILNDDVAVLAVANASAAEGNSGTTPIAFDVTLAAPAAVPVVATFTVSPGTAIAGQDFQSASGTVTFTPGTVRQTVTVLLFGDTGFEPDETFTITVTPPQGIPVTATGTILNDDVVLTVANASVTEGNSGTTPISFDITFTTRASVTVVVNYTVTSGTATAGQDFQSINGAVVFEAGVVRHTATVLVIGDTTFEPDETFTITVTPPEGTPVTATGTIVNDDPPPPSTITVVSGNNQQGIVGQRLALPLVVEVRNTQGAPAQNVTVQWRVSQGTATLSPTTSTTDAQGRASTFVTPTGLGDIEVEAVVTGLTAARFTIGTRVSLESRAQGPIAVPIARALDQICGRNAVFTAACNALSGLSDGQLTPALERVAPQQSGAQAKIAGEVVSAVTGGIGSRLAAVRSGAERFSIQRLAVKHNGRALPVATLASLLFPQEASIAGEDDVYNGWSAFLSGNIGEGERIGRDGQLGFDLASRGVMFGVDRLVGQSGIVGASVNWMNLDTVLDDNNGTVDTSGYALSIYASRAGLFAGDTPGRAFDGMHLDGSITAGRNTYDAEHVVEIAGLAVSRATSENDASVFAVSGGGGFEAHRGRTDIDFSLNGTWSRANIDDLTEEGTGPLILFVQGHEIESLTATAGLNVRAAFPVPFGVLLPSLRGELIHEFRGDARLVTARFIRDTLGTSFTIPLDQPDQNYGKVSAGLQAEFPRGWSAFAEVSQDVMRSDLEFRNLQFNIRKSF